MGKDEFLEQVKHCVTLFFSSIPQQHAIKHISHLDADGLSSAAIVVEMLACKDLVFTTSIVPSLDEKTLAQHVSDAYTHYIFSDLGSGQLSALVKLLAGKRVLILDHHDIEDGVVLPEGFFHVNPRPFGVDGNEEISGAGVCYVAACAADARLRNLAPLALLGATGDIQTKTDSFVGMNAEFFEYARAKGLLKDNQTLKYFGVSTKPLISLLEYSEDIIIPGVTGVKGASVRFLSEAGIHHELGGKEVKLADLTSVEMLRLVQAIARARKSLPHPEDIFCTEYVLLSEPQGKPTRNLKEFSTLLNACGRMKKFGVGIGVCLGDPAFRELAYVVQDAYKQKISESIRWYKSNSFEKGERYMIINGETVIGSTIIGTLASIVARQPDVPKGTHIIALARSEDAMTKVSIRLAGDVGEGINLNEVARQLCSDFGQAGGHSMAAGAVIPTAHESEFLENVRKMFSSQMAAVTAEGISSGVDAVDPDIL